MKSKPCLLTVFFISLVLSSCMLSTTTTQSASPTLPLLTQTSVTDRVPTNIREKESTLTPSPSPTRTFTPQATLDLTQAAYSISQYLNGSMNCNVPCFLGIVPGETTYNEAEAIFSRLGVNTWTIMNGDQTNYGNDVYLFENGLELFLHLVIYNGIVKWFTVDINPEIQQNEIPREWSVFSPEQLIRRYGQPTKVEFFMGRIGPPQQFDMDLYFDTVDLIVSYSSYRSDIRDVINFCPREDQFFSIRIYLGEDPENPPLEGSSLEDVSDISIAEFSEILTSDKGDGCVDLNPYAFP